MKRRITTLIAGLTTMEETVAAFTARDRFNTLLFAIFGGVALAIAAAAGQAAMGMVISAVVAAIVGAVIFAVWQVKRTAAEGPCQRVAGSADRRPTRPLPGVHRGLHSDVGP